MDLETVTKLLAADISKVFLTELKNVLTECGSTRNTALTGNNRGQYLPSTIFPISPASRSFDILTRGCKNEERKIGHYIRAKLTTGMNVISERVTGAVVYVVLPHEERYTEFCDNRN